MSKAILEFKLPEEQAEWVIANKANDLHSALYEIANDMRDITKHAEYKTIEARELAENIKNTFWSTLSDYGIDPYDEQN